jgi:hypothetical protein
MVPVSGNSRIRDLSVMTFCFGKICAQTSCDLEMTEKETEPSQYISTKIWFAGKQLNIVISTSARGLLGQLSVCQKSVHCPRHSLTMATTSGVGDIHAGWYAADAKVFLPLGKS